MRSETVPDVAFSWGRPTREDRDGAVRWTGYLIPPATSAYRFQVSSFDGYRVTVDGREVVNAWDAARPEDSVDREVTLTAGTPARIVVEARQKGSRGDQKLFWSGADAREDAAIAAARAADLIVFAGGLTAKLEGEEMRVSAAGFAGGDRTSLDLPAPQQALLERLHATGRPVVLVSMSGSAMALNWADRNIPAIIQAWYPGGTGGRAVADLIAGDFSPSGRLPVTFYRSADDLPPFKDYRMTGRTYRYFRGEALYPFGYGLSYTRFAYGRIAVPRTVRKGRPITVSTTVANVGRSDGAEVVELYVSRAGRDGPVRALKAFQRIVLKAGQRSEVHFTLDGDALATVSAAGERTVPTGPVDIWIGGGQPGQRSGLEPASGASATITVK